MASKLITFEGGEGAGKSTQLRLLAEALRLRGIAVVRTREPGGAPGAETLRSLLLAGDHEWSPMAEMLLHFAARAEHLARVIEPALNGGDWVLCDRFFDSTMAYQGFGQGADRSAIAQLSGMMGIVPDLTFVLDVTEPIAVARQRERGRSVDRYDRLGEGFHARVGEGFRRIAADHPGRCVLIDADREVGAVHAAIVRVVEERLMGEDLV